MTHMISQIDSSSFRTRDPAAPAVLAWGFLEIAGLSSIDAHVQCFTEGKGDVVAGMIFSGTGDDGATVQIRMYRLPTAAAALAEDLKLAAAAQKSWPMPNGGPFDPAVLESRKVPAHWRHKAVQTVTIGPGIIHAWRGSGRALIVQYALRKGDIFRHPMFRWAATNLGVAGHSWRLDPPVPPSRELDVEPVGLGDANGVVDLDAFTGADDVPEVNALAGARDVVEVEAVGDAPDVVEVDDLTAAGDLVEVDAFDHADNVAEVNDLDDAGDAPGENMDVAIDTSHRPLVETELAQVAINAGRAREALHLSKDAAPDAVLRALREVVERERASFAASKPNVQFNFTVFLGSLWGQTLCDSTGWQWCALTRGGGEEILAVVSPDCAYVISPVEFVARQLQRPDPDDASGNTIRLLYNMIAAGQLPPSAPDSYMMLG